MNIVQVKFFNNNKRYTYKLPMGIKIKKDTLLKVENKKTGGLDIVISVTDSAEVDENILNMIMQGKSVLSSVVGIYTLTVLSQSNKTKFRLKDYKGRYVMHCDTEEKAKVFCKLLHDSGKKWNAGLEYSEFTLWHEYEKNTCYDFNREQYSSINYFREEKYNILEFDDFDWSDNEEK